MLRISSIHDNEELRIKVHGRLAGRGVEELRKLALRHTPFGVIEVDMTEVRSVDKPGQELLIWLYRIGVEFRKGGLFSESLFKSLGIPTEDLIGPWPQTRHGN